MPHHADDVLLLATELIQNVTQHTADAGDLRITLHQDAALVEVADPDPHPSEAAHA